MSPSRSPQPVRILLCDDHAVVRAGLHALLSNRDDMKVVGEAASGEEAVAVAARVHPDVILMDLQLDAGPDGIATTRKLLAQAAAAPEMPTPRVLVLTMFDTHADITRAIKAGATGYLLKADNPQALYDAINAAAAGRTTLSGPVTDLVLSHLHTPPPALSERERHILRQLAEGHTNREIARALFLSETTVKSHLSRIFNKLNVQTRTAAVTKAAEQRLLD
ncbi:response regulator transcription factor [Streptomyces chiangmaiensis]|uniref:Response regulator transcription factor n=1 Tax=Streptomyces chiangmaiensis TaxID=766497 RepID=A0ABU7FJI3_9ACTN|nr:response regulator transcription factor [Streptomyces chiangmaiensis]MED7823988.1 response regulator transcription factor [Streptomyces chiangmaiensis]